MSQPLTPAILYRAVIGTDCQPSGPIRKKFPLPEQSPIQLAAYAFEQDFEMLINGNNFPPAAKNTPSSASVAGNLIFNGLGDDNAILTAYTEPTPTQAGKGKFTATFSIVPATWFDSGTIEYTFPGFPGLIGQTGSRDIRPKAVNTRIKYEYFVVDPTGILNGGIALAPGTGPTPSTIQDSGGNQVQIVYAREFIPVVNKSVFCVALGGVPDYTNITQSIVPVGGKVVGSQTYYETLPSYELYQLWIANAAANNWSSTVWGGAPEVATNPPTTTGQLVALDSAPSVYAGQIVCRETTYILAQ